MLSSWKITGPFEIVLHDPALKAEYKRLVLMLTLHEGVTFHLPKPKITLTTAEVIELVLEIDSRLWHRMSLSPSKQHQWSS